MALLKSLSSERERWMDGSETFKNQMLTIVGDVLLSAAFLAYAGQSSAQFRTTAFKICYCFSAHGGVVCTWSSRT